MTKRVLAVGNCRPDHGAIRSFIERSFDATVAQAHALDDTLAALESQPFDLVLINRKLDRDGRDGLDIIRRIKADARLADMPVMMITNFPEFQAAAVQAGAVAGFGKAELPLPQTLARLRAYLSSDQADS